MDLHSAYAAGYVIGSSRHQKHATPYLEFALVWVLAPFDAMIDRYQNMRENC